MYLEMVPFFCIFAFALDFRILGCLVFHST